MKKQSFLFLLLLAFVLPTFAQGPAAWKAEELDAGLRKHVSYLASDALEGRKAGENGSTFAAGYVANIFAKYKLKPGYLTPKGKKSFLQPFQYVKGVELGKDNKLGLVLGNDSPRKQLSKDWIPFGASPNVGNFFSVCVFAGHGIVSEELRKNDYAGVDVGAKFVVVFDGAPKDVDPRRFSIHTKAKIAKDKGAAGLIVVSNESDLSKDPNFKLKYDPATGETAIPVVIVAKTPELAKLEGTQSRQLSSTGTMMKIELIKKQAEVYNVIGVLEGTDPVLKNEAVVIGAHYDHLGRGGQGSLAVNSTEIHHGADDNASGVAAMLEIAGRFAKAKSNKRTLIFIGFGAEESGLVGSKYYVNNPAFPLDKTAAMLNMDMVGRLREKKLTVGGIGTASEWKDLVTKKNEVVPAVYGPATQPGPMATAAAPPPETVYRFSLQLSEDGFGPSDHASFYGKQVPVLFFFTGAHPDYHKPGDTADKLNYGGLAGIAEYVWEIAEYISNEMARKPAYQVAKSSGQGGGRAGFAVTLGVVPGYGESNDGLLLDGVRDGSPAAKAGLKAGDKLVKLAGKEIRNVQDYTVVLGELKPDVEYEVYVVRAGERLILKVTPQARR